MREDLNQPDPPADERGAPGAGDAPDGDFGQRREFYTFAPETLAQDLPEYEIVRELGKGTMGIVFEARRKADGERIALKLLPPSLTLTERALARFQREGRIMARIRHPDIVAVHEQGSRGRLHWFAMEYVDGTTLQERLEVGPLPVKTACQIGAQVARALQFAHDHGVVHRDIKPGNLMLRRGIDSEAAPRAAITDFGLARETGTGSMTESGAIVGTPMFMAPEQVLGGTAQANTLGDVYSLGASLYAALTGRPPFDGPTAQSVLKAVLDREPPAPRSLRADLPRDVETIIAKAMAKEPGQRYGSALEFAEDLERSLAGQRVLARRIGPVRRLVRTCARRPLLTLLVTAVLGLLAGTLVLQHGRDQEQLARALSEAERWLAVAATSRDEQERPRTAQERREFALAAVSAASEVITRDPQFAIAWFIRAKAHHRLRQFDEALHDLTEAERLRGEPTPEILHFRIDALRQQGGREATRQLQDDLTRLLQLDPGPHTRALVAEHLLEMAEHADAIEQAAALATAREILLPVDADEARTGVALARILELEGSIDEALAAMRRLVERHRGNVYVHLQAAAMYERAGLGADSTREQEQARLLEPGPQQNRTPTVELQGFGSFLQDVGRLMHDLDQPTRQATGTPPVPPNQPRRQ